jgi:hypothetical protein
MLKHQVKLEIKFKVEEDERISKKITHAHIYSLLVRMIENGGCIAGSEVFQEPFDLRSKAFKKQVEKLTESLFCPKTGRQMFLSGEHTHDVNAVRLSSFPPRSFRRRLFPPSLPSCPSPFVFFLPSTPLPFLSRLPEGATLVSATPPFPAFLLFPVSIFSTETDKVLLFTGFHRLRRLGGDSSKTYYNDEQTLELIGHGVNKALGSMYDYSREHFFEDWVEGNRPLSAVSGMLGVSSDNVLSLSLGLAREMMRESDSRERETTPPP